LKESYTQDPEHKWSYGNHPEASSEEMEQLKQMLVSNKQSFSYSMQDLPGYTGEPVSVELVDDKPIISPPRRYSQLEKQIMEEKCIELRDAGFIELADPLNKYASCPTMPAKKNEVGEWVERRFAIDYRAINAKTKTMRYSLDLPEELFQRVEGKRFLTSLDLRSGFHQLPLDDFAKTTTAFWWGKQLWQFKRLPYGARNSVYSFQGVMDKVLREAGLSECAWAYVDDVLICSSSMEEHIRDVQAVLQALHAVGLRVHPGKSVFCSDKLEYLGHVITPEGIEPQAAKVAAMASLPIPTSVSTLQSFMGLLNYYRCYCPQFSSIAKPLNKLLQKGVAFEWGQEQQQAYDTLKQQLCSEPVLRRADPSKQFILHTDWSQHGLGAVLAQLDDEGREYMVACASRSLNIHERNYTPWKGELLAVVWGIKTFRVYLHGVSFELVTDHQPLLWLLNQNEPTGQQARWVLSLMEYDFTVRHRAGTEHVNADVLSRHPLPTTEDGTGAQLDQAGDPVRPRLPKVVFGPVGTGTPREVDPATIPEEMPVEQQQQRQRRQPQQGSNSPQEQQQQSAAAEPPAQQQQQPRRKKMSKAAYRRAHQDPYAVPAVVPEHLIHSVYQPAVATVSLAVAAAQGRALYVQQQLACSSSSFMDEFTFQQVDPWELPYSCWADPLADQQVSTAATERQQALQAKATGWVSAVTAGELTAADNDSSSHSRSPYSLQTASVAATFFPAAAAGLVVYEPFGGLCSGLEMVLRNGFAVHTYLYSDIDPVAQQVAAYRLQQLQAQYPGLLPATALGATFTALPQDVWQITSQHLQAVTSQYQRQWLVVGGWECQDLSPAGHSRGLTGDRSSTIAPLVQILAQLQQLMPQLPPAYIVENTAMQYNSQLPQQQYSLICAALGQPVCIDATQFDSLAHRVRNYWTNLCTQQQLQAAVQQAQRTPGLTVQSVIDPQTGRQAMPVTADEAAHSGRYPANKAGQPRSAWPTFVAYPMSRAFRPGEPGAVLDPRLGLTEPSAAEREEAMGYDRGSTRAPGITEQQRRGVLGRCIDANVLQSIMAIAAAWHRRGSWQVGVPGVVAAAARVQGREGEQGRELERQGEWEAAAAAAVGLMVQLAEPAAEEGYPNLEQYLVGVAVAALADAAEQGSPDIWLDTDTLHYLQQQQCKHSWSAAVRDRVKKRAAGYVLTADRQLRRKLADGSTKLVPKPEQRKELILQFHKRSGHYGVRRTGALISNTYWWWGLWADVAAELAKCSVCNRVNTSFHAGRNPELHPLPISGLMYRWGVDLCGPFEKTARGNQYVLVAVEHYSKHLELVPIPDKEPATVAAAFTAAVLGRYGSPAEVLTDRGGEWMKEFDQLLLDCMVDHRRTSASHPPANGLTERAVATVKRALSKLCSDQGSQLGWDLHLPWLMLGYNASPQKSTGFSPYQLMHGVTPIVPPAIREPLSQPMEELADKEAVAQDFLARSQLVKQRCIIAGENLQIAQHRDTLRYAKVRSGGYTPQLRHHQPGDYVYIKRKQKEGLDILAKPLILRVVEVKPSGVLYIQGRCGTVRAVHVDQCAPCHLPNIDPTIDYSLARPPADAVCEQCGTDNEAQQGKLIFCDNCNSGWHLGCCTPLLSKQPKGTWVCQQCEQQGITLEAVQAMQQAGDSRAAEQQKPEKYTPAQLRAQALDGRLLKKQFTVAQGGRAVTGWYLGRVHFRGRAPGGNLLIVYEDGDAEITTLWSLQRDKVEWLPEGTPVPEGVQFREPAAAEAQVRELSAAREAAAQAARSGRGREREGQGRARQRQQTQGRTGQQQNQRAQPQSAGVQTRSRSNAQQSAVAEAAGAAVAASASLPTVTALTAAASSAAAGVIQAGTPAITGTQQLSLVSIWGTSSSLPAYWDLTTPAGVKSAMQRLMPGPLADKDATRLSNTIGRVLAVSKGEGSVSKQPGAMGYVPTDPAEVQPLLAAVDFSGCSTLYDPYAGGGTIATAFAAAGFRVQQNDLNPYWEQPTAADALQPQHYQFGPQAIVTSPPFELLDLAVPLAAAQAGAVACLHVPGHWVSNPRVARQQWLQQLAAEGRLHIILGLPRGPSHRRCAWVVVFRHASIRATMLRVAAASAVQVSYANL